MRWRASFQRETSFHSSLLLGRQMVGVKTTAPIAKQRHPLSVCKCMCVYSF